MGEKTKISLLMIIIIICSVLHALLLEEFHFLGSSRKWYREHFNLLLIMYLNKLSRKNNNFFLTFLNVHISTVKKTKWARTIYQTLIGGRLSETGDMNVYRGKVSCLSIRRESQIQREKHLSIHKRKFTNFVCKATQIIRKNK